MSNALQCCSSAARSSEAGGDCETSRRFVLELAKGFLKQATNDMFKGLNGWKKTFQSVKPCFTNSGLYLYLSISLKEGSIAELLCTAEMEHGTDMKMEWTLKVAPASIIKIPTIKIASVHHQNTYLGLVHFYACWLKLLHLKIVMHCKGSVGP